MASDLDADAGESVDLLLGQPRMVDDPRISVAQAADVLGLSVVQVYRRDQLYTGNSRYTPAEQAERAADYFAACFLMPKRQLKAAWARGVQTSSQLAREFDVSVLAMEVRLSQTRINAAHDTNFPLPSYALTRARRAMDVRPFSTEGV